MEIEDAARICYGDQIAEDCATNEDQKDARQAAYDEFYHIEWQAIPSRFKGSLLLESISEIMPGDTVDDDIVAAYAVDDKAAAVDALFRMIDTYRKRHIMPGLRRRSSSRGGLECPEVPRQMVPGRAPVGVGPAVQA